jgi:hypothetical protein
MDQPRKARLISFEAIKNAAATGRSRQRWKSTAS